MRAILESYDSELTPAEHSPQLNRRMREAEDMVQKLHAHNTELEVTKQHPASCSSPRGGGVETSKVELPGDGICSCRSQVCRVRAPKFQNQ